MVADFGIAKALSSLGGRELTRTGFPIGTPGYMSPEQAAGITELDARSDVFSLGAVVYEMLLGDTPRFWLSEEAVRSERLADAPPQHRSRLDALPRAVEQALAGALALKQQDRLASPADFITALRENSSGTRRRYRESEVQDIVKRASEAEAKPTDAGMTIGGVQSLGAEVGIAPEEMAKAARGLEHRKPRDFGATLLGTPLSLTVRDHLPGRLEPSEQVDLLNVVREVIGQQGKMAEVMGSLEWRSQGTENITVTITQRRDDVGVVVMADRSNAAALSYIFPLLFCMVAAVIRVDEVQPGILGTLAILGTGAVAGIAIARTAFVLSGRALRRKLDRLQSEVKGYLSKGN